MVLLALRRLDTDNAQIPGVCGLECAEEFGYERHQVLQAVGMRPEQDDGERAIAQVLLKADAPVDRDERIALPSKSIQQRPIIEVGASEQATDGCDVVSWQKPRQPHGHARIKDDAHLDRLRRAGFGLAYQGLPREFEDGDRVFARDIGEVRKKLGELMSTLDVVNNRTHWHASTRETGLATEAREARRYERVREGHRKMDRVAPYKVTDCRSCG